MSREVEVALYMRVKARLPVPEQCSYHSALRREWRDDLWLLLQLPIAKYIAVVAMFQSMSPDHCKSTTLFQDLGEPGNKRAQK